MLVKGLHAVTLNHSSISNVKIILALWNFVFLFFSHWFNLAKYLPKDCSIEWPELRFNFIYQSHNRPVENYSLNPIFLSLMFHLPYPNSTECLLSKSFAVILTKFVSQRLRYKQSLPKCLLYQHFLLYLIPFKWSPSQWCLFKCLFLMLFSLYNLLKHFQHWFHQWVSLYE